MSYPDSTADYKKEKTSASVKIEYQINTDKLNTLIKGLEQIKGFDFTIEGYDLKVCGYDREYDDRTKER